LAQNKKVIGRAFVWAHLKDGGQGPEEGVEVFAFTFLHGQPQPILLNFAKFAAKKVHAKNAGKGRRNGSAGIIQCIIVNCN
jgi:hypothetical protein